MILQITCLVRQSEAHVYTPAFLTACCVFIRALDLYHVHQMQEAVVMNTDKYTTYMQTVIERCG